MRRLIKLIKYDIKMGYIGNAAKILIFGILCVGICIIGNNAISALENENIRASIGDYVCFVLGGPKHIFNEVDKQMHLECNHCYFYVFNSIFRGNIYLYGGIHYIIFDWISIF